MFSVALVNEAQRLIEDLTARQLTLATAESCTGGLIAALLTEIAGSSHVLERGFVTYSVASKSEAIGVDAALIDRFGVVSREVALAMAEGAIRHSHADLSVAVTGVAGPEGGTAAKPVGLVHIAAARGGGGTLHEECRFGGIGRAAIREAAVVAALKLVRRVAAAA